MAITTSEAIGSIAKYSTDTRDKLNTTIKQRRYGTHNNYGLERTTVGGASRVARFYVPITPDMVSFTRWEFKIVIEPFLVPTSSEGVIISETELHIGNTSLSSSNNNISPNPHGHTITPNPHTHSSSVVAGITLVDPELDNFKILIDGHDMTSIFASQFPMPDEEGMFPDDTIANRYDIIDACNVASESVRNDILSGGMHTIEFQASGLFQVKILEFLHYNYIIRQGNTGDTDTLMTRSAKLEDETVIDSNLNKYDLTIRKREIIEELNDLPDTSPRSTARKLVLETEMIELNTELERIARIEAIQEKGE